MSRAVQADVSVFSIGGASQLAYFRNVAFEYPPTLADGRALNSRSPRNDVVKRQAKIMTGLMSNVGTATTAPRVANLDVSQLLLGAFGTTTTVSYVSLLRGGSMSIQNTFAEGSGVGDAWRVPIWTTQKITTTLQIMVPTSAFPEVGAIIDGSIAAHNLTVALTINGTTLSVESVLASYKHTFENDQVQMLDLSFEQRATTAQTGPATTTILGAAILQPGTALACALTSRSSNGSAYTGDFVIESCNFSFNDAEIITNDYTLLSTGAVAQA